MGPGSSKKRNVSGGPAALLALGDQFSAFNDIYRNRSTSRPTALELSPNRKRNAIERAEELETELDDERLVQLINIFETDVSAADAYMVIKRDGLRKAWVKAKLAPLNTL